MNGPEPTPGEGRHPAALANAIAVAWRPYRWRAYALGFLAGLFVGGVAAPIATTSLSLVVHLAGGSLSLGVPWTEVVWTIAFVLTVPVVGATAYARWQPRRLRLAAQTYVWLAMRAERNWARVFGAQPVPRDDRSIRGVLASIPETPGTAGERFGLWIALLELDHARAAVAQMPQSTATQRCHRACAAWLADLVAGTPRPLDSLQTLVEAIDDADERLEAAVTLAVNRARVALSEGRDWRLPLVATRDLLGTAPEPSYLAFLWRPTYRTLLIATAVGVAVFWLALLALTPYFPLPSR